MIKGESFFKPETPRTKEGAQQELIEKFGIRKTSDFQEAIIRGQKDVAQKWLDYIVEHKESFPQYAATWDNWLKDRQADLNLEVLPTRTKEEAQTELKEKFGFYDTAGFRNMIISDKEKAQAWLNYIVNHKADFPQYLGCWDRWLTDRNNELSA